MINKDEITLRVAGNTNTNDLRTAVAGYLQSGKKVLVDAVGERANYQALKSIVAAKGAVAAFGLTMSHDIIKIEIEMLGSEVMKTAYRWILTVTQNY